MADEDTAVLTYPGGQHEMAIKAPTEGASAVDVSKLLAKSGMTTFDPGFTFSSIALSFTPKLMVIAGHFRLWIGSCAIDTAPFTSDTPPVP